MSPSRPRVLFGNVGTGGFGGSGYGYGGNNGLLIPSQYLNINWNRDGKMTNIKNQGNCGSAWAFAAISDL